MKQRSATGLGATTLIMLFSVLCLCVFALLSLSTAKAELNLSRRMASSVGEYYAADEKAILAMETLTESGSIDAAALDLQNLEQDGRSVSYGVTINSELTLFVELESAAEGWQVKRWQVVDTGEWDPDDTLDVWDGMVILD